MEIELKYSISKEGEGFLSVSNERLSDCEHIELVRELIKKDFSFDIISPNLILASKDEPKIRYGIRRAKKVWEEKQTTN